MLDKKDAQWWILEAQNHPESAVDLIRMLADRLVTLDRQNEELRGELMALKRKQRGVDASPETSALRQRIEELESALRHNTGERRAVVYGPGRIEANVSLDSALATGIDCELTADVSLLIGAVTAKLFAVCGDARVFSLKLSDLPVPNGAAIVIDQPRDVVALLDQSAFDQNRYLILISRAGYAFSILAGTLNRAAARQESLIRNLLPDDPIIAAVPSNNADLFAISRKGRWTRFAEKSLAGTGSLVMELPKGDGLASLLSLTTETDLLFLTAEGKLFARASADLLSRKTPGRSAGMLFRDQQILSAAPGRAVTILTRNGKLIPVQPGQLMGRAQTEAGLPVPGLNGSDAALTMAS